MKKLLNLLAVTVVVLSGFASCVKAELTPVAENEKAAEVTLEAVLAESQATKTSVNDAGNVYWNPRDSIMVFFGDYAVPFVSYNQAPSAKALFVGTSLTLAGSNENATGELDGYTYWSVYPMQTRKAMYVPSRNGESVFAYVDALQTGKAGTFDNSTFVTVACSTDWKQLSFYNLCGGIRFKVTGEDIDIVTFKGNDGEKLAGEVSVKMDASGLPFPAEVYSIQPELQLRAPAGECFKPGVWYYIVSLPAQLSKGYTMNFVSTAAGKIATKTVSDAKEIKRSVFGEIADADAGLEWVEGFDESMLGDMEDAIEVTKVVYNEETKNYELEVVYHNRYIQQLAEKVHAVYSINESREFWLKDNTHIALVTPRVETGNYARSSLTYDESVRLDMAFNQVYSQLYLLKGQDTEEGRLDLSTASFAKVHGAAASALRYGGEYLKSSEDESEHYFFVNANYWDYNTQHKVRGLFALKEDGEKVYLKQLADLSPSVILENGYIENRQLGNDVFYLLGYDYDKRVPVAEAFGLDGSYRIARLELEEGYHTYSSVNHLTGPYYQTEGYLDNEEDGSRETCQFIFWMAVKKNGGDLVLLYYILPGYERGSRWYNDNLLFITSGGWCLATPNNIIVFPYESFSYGQWDQIDKFGRAFVFAADPSDFTVNYLVIDPYAGTVNSKLLELPEYDGDVWAYFGPSQNECYVYGRTQNGTVISVIDADTGEVKETYPFTGSLPDEEAWNWSVGYWRFDRSAIKIDGDFSDWDSMEAIAGDSELSAIRLMKARMDNSKLFFYIEADAQQLMLDKVAYANYLTLYIYCNNAGGDWGQTYEWGNTSQRYQQFFQVWLMQYGKPTMANWNNGFAGRAVLNDGVYKAEFCFSTDELPRDENGDLGICFGAHLTDQYVAMETDGSEYWSDAVKIGYCPSRDQGFYGVSW